MKGKNWKKILKYILGIEKMDSFVIVLKEGCSQASKKLPSSHKSFSNFRNWMFETKLLQNS